MAAGLPGVADGSGEIAALPGGYDWLDAYHRAMGRDPAAVKTVSLAEFTRRSARHQ